MATLLKSYFLVMCMAETFRVLWFWSAKMSSSTDVKREIVGKLSEANANEKYLYSRVMELEKRNQRLEKRVKKLKRKKEELKQEVAELRGEIQSQESEGGEGITGQDEVQGVSQSTLCNILKLRFWLWLPLSLIAHSKN